eukprot:TRINITY_DN2074_c0_g3_i1.p1 TRINITY_DN2074_c0_g3~~TRINITY_DN2074_c0_g3_i1.p1  ORF type:complete len:489 (-),score=135.80 TRINITY_DN2074_c0_g3_i1:807-2273(-)
MAGLSAEDFERLQGELIQLKQTNYDLKAQNAKLKSELERSHTATGAAAVTPPHGAPAAAAAAAPAPTQGSSKLIPMIPTMGMKMNMDTMGLGMFKKSKPKDEVAALQAEKDELKRTVEASLEHEAEQHAAVKENLQRLYKENTQLSDEVQRLKAQLESGASHQSIAPGPASSGGRVGFSRADLLEAAQALSASGHDGDVASEPISPSPEHILAAFDALLAKQPPAQPVEATPAVRTEGEAALVSSLRADLARLTEQHAQFRLDSDQNISTIHQQLESWKRKCLTNQESVAKLEKEKEELAAQAKKAAEIDQARIRALKECENLTGAIKQVKAQLEMERIRGQSSASGSQELHDTIQKLQAEIAGLKEEIVKTKASRDEAVSSASDTKRQLSELQEQHTLQAGQHETFRQAIDQLTRDLSAAEAKAKQTAAHSTEWAKEKQGLEQAVISEHTRAEELAAQIQLKEQKNWRAGRNGGSSCAQYHRTAGGS